MFILDTMNYSTLQYLGLDETKIKVYVAVVELGSAKASQIAENCLIKRTSIYDILKKLHAIGLIQVTTIQGEKFFKATDPRRLQVMMERRTQEVKETITSLSALYKSSEPERPNIRFFEGSEGIKEIFNEIITENPQKIYSTLTSQIIINELAQDAHFITEWSKERVSRGIHFQSLRNSPSDNKISKIEDGILIGEDEKWLREIRYLPSEIIPENTIVLWNKNVAILSTKKENYSLVIESKGYFDTMKQIFDYLWKLSKNSYTLKEIS